MSEPQTWVIGAAVGCDIIVGEETVSGRHCRLKQTDGGYELIDLGSTNGTYVNGTKIDKDKPVPVSLQDRITLGAIVPFPWYAIVSPESLSGEIPAVPSAKPQKPAEDEQRETAKELETHIAPPAEIEEFDKPAKTDGGQKDKTAETSPPKLPPPPKQPARTITIGREVDNDVVLNNAAISRYHARLTVDGDTIRLEDLGSSNGTAVGDQNNKVKSAQVDRTDTVFFGTYKTSVDRLISQTEGERRGATIGFQHNTLVLGRDESCDQVLDFPMISRRHARLIRAGNDFIVEDLGSSNGTFVNGNRVKSPAAVKPGDTITLGSFTFQLTPDGQLEQRDYRGSFVIEADTLCIDVPKKRLLDKISLTILPNEFVGLMGPSGAGKSTLMNSLNGYTPPSEGSVFINGHDLYREFDLFRGQIGFVPQDDIVHRELTVEQALFYTARLRLPKDFSNEDIRKRIGEVLESLDLLPQRHLRIGDENRSVLSGGQRKRVNLAMELITDPSILFLDEPTSGLSSEDTVKLMTLLRKLADDGKTILLTIHQPSLEVFRLMDHLVIVAKDAGSPEPGRLAYFGPAYPDSIQFFNPPKPGKDQSDVLLSPDEVLRGLGKDKADTWVRNYRQSNYHKDYVAGRKETRAKRSGGSMQRHRKENGWLQWLTLSQRCLRIKLKDTVNTAILLAQAPIIALLVVFVFGDRAREEMTLENFENVVSATATSVFLIALAALWFGCSNAVREIVAEWSVYRRERMVNLKIWPYVASKFTVLGGLCVIQCFILMMVVYFGAGLKGNWFGMFVLLVIASLVGLAIGLTVSALVRTSEVAVALLPLILLPMVILGGALQPLKDMNPAIRGIAHLMPSRWGFEGLLLIESKANGRELPKVPRRRSSYRSSGDTRLAQSSPSRTSGRSSRTTTRRPPSSSRSSPPSQLPSAKKIEMPEDMADVYFQVDEHRAGIAAAFFVLLLMLGALVGGIFLILKLRDIH